MSDQTLRTNFVWNTEDVKRGAAEIDKSYTKLMDAERRLARYKKVYGTDSKTGLNKNTVQGLKDLGEGRTLFGLSRLAKESRALLIPLGGIGIAALAAKKAFNIVREEMKATTDQSKRLRDSFNATNRAATFSTSADGFSSLSGTRGGLETQLAGERAQQTNLSTLASSTDANPASRLFWKARNSIRRSDFMTGLFGEEKDTTSMQRESAAQIRATENSLKTNRRLGNTALEREVTRARMGGPTGESDTFATRRFELQIAEEKELAEVRKERGSDDKAALDMVRRRFEWSRKTVDAEEAIARAKFKGASAELTIAGGGGSALAKQLGASGVRARLSRGLLASGTLNAEQGRAELLAIQGESNTVRGALMDRYLDPTTGKRRRAGLIQWEFRNERNATRRRNAFLRKVDAGQYNLETGRKASIGGASGLVSGGLLSGALSAPAAKGKPDPNVFLDRILAVLESRLPEK